MVAIHGRPPSTATCSIRRAGFFLSVLRRAAGWWHLAIRSLCVTITDMKHFVFAITINASPDAIWALLTDAAGYPRWNSTVERIDGRIAAGGSVTVDAKTASGRAFPLKVTEFVPGQRMTWAGGMPLGLFAGTRHFTLTSLDDGQVRFAMEETYSGLLAPLITRSIPDLQPAFDTFAADLKRQAESLRSA